jgi:3-phosphoshikimate 1-carboxyvinyltransferase
MRQRPIGPLVDGLRELGATIDYEMREGYPPLVVSADGLAGGDVTLPGTVSSQYFSAILMAGAHARDGVRVNVADELVSRPYLDMTSAVAGAFGIEIENRDYRQFRVAPGQVSRGVDYAVEADASAATYFLAAGALCGGPVRVVGLSAQSVQGDVGFARTLEEMGAKVTWGPDWIGVAEGSLRGVDADYADMSDAAPTLAVVAAFAEGTTTIRGVGHMRHKETDRVAALAAELGRVGIEVTELEDGLHITGGRPHGASIPTYDDHRMAMSFALVGLRTPGVRIQDPGCVSKTYPEFFTDLEALRPPKA